MIDFVERVENVGFTEAVEKLAGRAGVDLSYRDESPAEKRRREMRPRLEEVMETVVAFYSDCLFKRPESKIARSYLLSRGYDKKVAEAFRLGWAPDEWDAAARHLKRAGFRQDEIAQSGVAKLSARGTLVDHIRGRLIFPIFDDRNQPVAVAGRILDDQASGPDGVKVPKYVNSPETPLYAKSRTLYALNWAKSDIVARGEAVIVEGYTDVIGFHRAGVTQTVAACGTALGEGHLRLLKRFAGRLVLAFDGDTVGAAATERVFDIATKLDLDVRVALLPKGKDPAEVAAEGPEAVAAVLDGPRPLLEFKVDRAVAAIPLDSVENENRALKAGAAAIAAHPDPNVRLGMARVLSRRLRDATEDMAIRKVEELRRSRRSSDGGRDDGGLGDAPTGARPRGDVAHGGGGLNKIEEHALGALLQAPGAFLDAEPEASADWFGAPAARRIAEAALRVARSARSAPVSLDACALDADLLDIARRLAMIDPPGFDDVAVFAKDAATSLHRTWVEIRISELQRSLQAAENAGDHESVRALDSELVAFIARRRSSGDM